MDQPYMTPVGPDNPLNHDERIARLEERVRQLEWIIEEYTEARRLIRDAFPTPIVPTNPDDPHGMWPIVRNPIYPTVVEDRCRVCQGLFKDMTLYVCTHTSCPSRISYTS